MSGFEIVGLLVAAAAVIASGILVIAETSLTHLRRARAQTLVDEGAGNARLLLGLVESRDRVLNPVLLLVLACHLGAATIVGAVAGRHLGAGGVVVAYLVLLGVIFVAAEALPKTWALSASDRAALRIAPIVGWLVRLPPLRWATNALLWLSNKILRRAGRSTGPTITEEELLALTDAAANASAIERGEHRMIESVLDFGDTIVRALMTPRPDMVVVQLDDTVADATRVVLDHGHTRLPVCRDGIDDVVGMVHARDLLRHALGGALEMPVPELLRAVSFVPETKRASELLPELRAEASHLAVVVDEYGGTAGLVTLEDLIEELVGEIVDEFDRAEPLVYDVGYGGSIVHGRMPIDEVNELFDADLPDDDWDTVGGFIFNTLGHVPEVDELVIEAGLELRVAGVEGRRITKVEITPADAGAR